MLQPWVYQFKGVGASSPNTPWNLSRWGTRCCERDEEREKQKQLLTACQGDRREKGRLLVYHHWKMVIVSNKETTSDHNQNTEQLGRDLLFAATGMIKGRQKPTRWCSQVDRTSVGRREGTGVSWSIWVVAEHSQFFFVFLIYEDEDVIFTLLQDKQNWDLGWYHFGFGLSCARHYVLISGTLPLPAPQQQSNYWLLELGSSFKTSNLGSERKSQSRAG